MIGKATGNLDPIPDSAAFDCETGWAWRLNEGLVAR